MPPFPILQPARRVAEINPAATETAAKDDQYRKELDDIKKTMRSEVKIKLKKDGKGAYSWEIQGKDAAEVLKTNDTLKKKLGD